LKVYSLWTKHLNYEKTDKERRGSNDDALDKGKGFIKELMELYPEPKPHYNTLSIIIRVLEEKGYVNHKVCGRNHEYFPLVTKEKYCTNIMK
jgi:hypothetical protein